MFDDELDVFEEFAVTEEHIQEWALEACESEGVDPERPPLGSKIDFGWFDDD